MHIAQIDTDKILDRFEKSVDRQLDQHGLDRTSDEAVAIAIGLVEFALEIIDKASEDYDSDTAITALFTDLTKALEKLDNSGIVDREK